MKAIVITVLILQQTLLPAWARAAEPIRFLAQVESEALAEEAILLLHCLAARAGTSWEFSGEASGRHWMSVEEKKGLLEGVYQREAAHKKFLLRAGQSDDVCDQLEPAAAPALPAEPKLAPALVTVEEDSGGKGRAWLWVGIGAALVGGFLVWRSRQPDHRGVEMR